METEIKYRWVYTGTNPYTGKEYFERRKEEFIDPSQSPEEPPDANKGLLTKKEFEKQRDQKAARDFEKFGHPTKGSEPSSDFEPDDKKST